MFVFKSLVLGFGMMLFFLGGGRPSQHKQIYFNSTGESGRQVGIEFQDEQGETMLTLRSGDGSMTIDPSEIASGETRTYTLDNGEEVWLRRMEDESLVLTMDGEDIQLFHADGDHVWVHADDTEIGDVLVEEIDFSNTVTIGGLDGLDENEKQRIIDALRDAGVTKEIRFFPVGAVHAGHGQHMMFIGDDDIHEHGNVRIIKVKEGKPDHKRKVIIKKQ